MNLTSHGTVFTKSAEIFAEIIEYHPQKSQKF